MLLYLISHCTKTAIITFILLHIFSFRWADDDDESTPSLSGFPTGAGGFGGGFGGGGGGGGAGPSYSTRITAPTRTTPWYGRGTTQNTSNSNKKMTTGELHGWSKQV